MRRTWIKLYVDQCLRGSMIEELTAEQRWMWIGLLLLAGDSSIPGQIFRRKDEDGIPTGFSEITLAETLDISPEIFHDGLDRMTKKGKVEVNEKGVIKILNWKKYQNEYQRQKPYRDGENSGYNISSNQSDDVDGDVDGDIDVEREEEREEEDTTPAPPTASNFYPKKQEPKPKAKRTKFSAEQLEALERDTPDELAKLPAYQRIRFSRTKTSQNGTPGKWDFILQQDVDDWRETFPSVNIQDELKQARAWLMGDPSRIYINYAEFLRRWFTRTMNRGGTRKPFTSRPGSGQETASSDWAARKQAEMEKGKSHGR